MLLLLATAVAATLLPAAAAADAGCWGHHFGVCEQYSDGGCPFTDGWFTWTGCDGGHYCCVPPRPAARQRTPQGDCGRRHTGSGFVIGGSVARPGHWPWLAQIWKNGAHHCGGVLIHRDWLLTAGHCFAFPQPGDEVTIDLGHTRGNSSQRQSLGISRALVHERFFQPLFSNDIALLRLNESARLHELVWPICLPEPGEVFHNTAAVVAGWGATEDAITADHLQEVQLPIVPLQECRRLYQPSGRPVFDQNLCAGFRLGGRDSCGGDSGGPLMLERDGRWVAGGLVSHGDGCAEAGSPGVYASVGHFVAWIRGHVGAV